ncbi:uncharacterized protein LOC108597953 [Drosophila busckii]|uniref:uncharacterized protein LOC108597953 n=1 Tax=Drosophila busckii TaxID=30019 RepID=UPI00083F0D61|nr:uncharacterized protein LOC108597953 [Drosophila busckii]
MDKLWFNVQFDEFYSRSFVRDHIIVSYSLQDAETLSYNMTIKTHFPGKLLMHVFVRKLDDLPGGANNFELFKMKNMDFCKSLEALRNVSMEHYQNESILPSTFLVSCPIIAGFYYVKDAHFDVSLMPLRIKKGRYLVNIELIQVYEEVTKLVNCKIKVAMRQTVQGRPPKELKTTAPTTEQSEQADSQLEYDFEESE